MYPGTIFTIDDQSDIEALTISDTIEPPVQMIGFSSDKGTEDFIYIRGNAFFKQFGEKISFAKHGQPLLQAANAINNGGRLFCKRIVAPDSTLANIGIVGSFLYYKIWYGLAKVKTSENKKFFWTIIASTFLVGGLGYFSEVYLPFIILCYTISSKGRN